VQAVEPRPAGSRLAGAAKILVGFAVTGLFLWLLLGRLSLAEIGAALAAADLSLLPLALVSLALGYAARITRWWLMLRPAAPELSWGRAAGPFLVSIAVNNVAPLRAGDVLRLFAFRGNPALGPVRVLATVVVERVLDLSALLVVFFLVLPFVPEGRMPEGMLRMASLVAGLGAAAALGLFLFPTLGARLIALVGASKLGQQSGLVRRLLGVAETLVESLRSLAGRRLAGILLLTAVAWVLEGGVFVAAASALGVAGGLPAAFFALATATLATLLPSSPGYVGTFHFFAAQAAIAFGTAAGAAAAFAVAAHLVLWGATTLAGLVAALLMLASRRAGLGLPPASPELPPPATKV